MSIIYGSTFYPFLTTFSHFLPFGFVGKSVKDHYTLYTVYPFALVWHILSKGQLITGEDNHKLLIGTSKKMTTAT